MKIEKCKTCGHYHIYKKSCLPFSKYKAIQYLYRELFYEGWINRSFKSEHHVRAYLINPSTNNWYNAGERCDKNDNICLVRVNK